MPCFNKLTAALGLSIFRFSIVLFSYDFLQQDSYVSGGYVIDALWLLFSSSQILGKRKLEMDLAKSIDQKLRKRKLQTWTGVQIKHFAVY